MTIKNGKFVIYAFHEYETESVLNQLKTMGIDTGQCHICGEPIRKTKRQPRMLFERIRAKLWGRQYYSWNVGGISKTGVICESFNCLLRARDQSINHVSEDS